LWCEDAFVGLYISVFVMSANVSFAFLFVMQLRVVVAFLLVFIRILTA